MKRLKKQVLVVHGVGVPRLHRGSVYWKAKLEDALGEQYEVSSPRMPDPEHPRYAAWRSRVEEALAGLEGELVLVGHSLGGSVLLKYLSEETPGKPISGLFLIAAPYWGRDGGWEGDEFALRKDISKLSQVPRIFLYHGRDDEEVPFAHLGRYASRLPQATVRALDGRGHEFYNDDIPEIVDDIRGL